MKRFIVFIVVAIIATMLGVVPSQVSAIDSVKIQGTISSQNPANSKLILKNTTATACQVANTAVGTIAITKVVQDGREVTPSPMELSFEDGLEQILPAQLKTLQPGESLAIPLQTTKSGDKIGLQSLAWSQGGGTLGMIYMVKPDLPLQIELNYSVPIDSPASTPICDTVHVSNVDKTTWIWSGILVLVLAIVIFLIGIVAFILRRRNKKTGIKPVMALLALAGSMALLGGLLSQPVSAQVTVPDSVRGEWDACVATLEANRDITGPILDIINNPSIRIIIDPRSTGGAYMAAWPDGTYHIEWNVNDRHPYAGTGGNADPCTSIYHELYHILDMENRTFSRDDCAGSGIEIKEVMAVRAQNALRVRLGMPPRSHYGDRPLPTGDCRAAPTPPACRGAGCARSTGDPHLRTFDGRHYDFQAAGEFILAKAGNTLEVQVRQEPWEDSRWVAINTAVVVKTAGHIFQVAPSGHKLGLLIDGKKRSLKSLESKDGVTLVAMMNETRLDITAKDGTTVSLVSVGNYGIDVIMDPSDALKGKVEGLLGNYDEEQKNDLRVHGKDITIGPDFDQLYPVYADSWRVDDQTTLFTYAAGESTKSFTNRAFPYERFDAKSQPGYVAAAEICKRLGVVDPISLADCALDVMVTGRPEFARSAVRYQKAQMGSTSDSTSYTLSAKNPNDIAKVTFTAKKGDKVFVDVVSSTFPNLCSPISLNDAEDKVLGNGCIINGKGHIETEILPADGTYSLQLRANDKEGGDAHIRLYKVVDQIGSVLLDGNSVTAKITTPGMQARLTFRATAGQRLFANATKATLPNQCSPLSFVNPSGNSITSSCIIGGNGVLDITADESGEYALVVNPGDVSTGKVDLRLTTSQIVTKTLTLGESSVVTLAKPGNIAQLSFAGKAGQRVYVDISDITLPGQCGGFTMHMPNGDTANGCIIGEVSSLEAGGTVLPVSGNYMIIVDPTDANTGRFSIRVRQ